LVKPEVGHWGGEGGFTIAPEKGKQRRKNTRKSGGGVKRGRDQELIVKQPLFSI